MVKKGGANVADKEREATGQTHESNPGTEPFVPDFDTGDYSVPVSTEFDAGEPSVPFVPNFDTGEYSVPVNAEFEVGEPSVPFVPNFDTDSQPFLLLGGLKQQPVNKSEPAPQERKAEPKAPSPAWQPDSAADSPGPVTVPGRYLYLKWWKFVLVLLGTWFFAAVFGLSLFYWWYHTIDKTPPVFTVFVYVVACTVGGLILAMVESKPLIAALAIAVMSAPFASVSAAAPLYGSFYCEHVTTPCLMGVIPYE